MCKTPHGDPLNDSLPFKIAHSALMDYNKKSGFKCMFVVCITYYIWDGAPSPNI